MYKIGLGPVIVVLIVLAIVGVYMGIVHWFIKSAERPQEPFPSAENPSVPRR